MRRGILALGLGITLQFGGCFPNYFFQDLLASSFSSAWSILLTEVFDATLNP